MTQSFFVWTSYSVEADSQDEASEKFIEAVKEKMVDLVIEEE